MKCLKDTNVVIRRRKSLYIQYNVLNLIDTWFYRCLSFLWLILWSIFVSPCDLSCVLYLSLLLVTYPVFYICLSLWLILCSIVVSPSCDLSCVLYLSVLLVTYHVFYRCLSFLWLILCSIFVTPSCDLSCVLSLSLLLVTYPVFYRCLSFLWLILCSIVVSPSCDLSFVLSLSLLLVTYPVFYLQLGGYRSVFTAHVNKISKIIGLWLTNDTPIRKPVYPDVANHYLGEFHAIFKYQNIFL